MSLSSAHNAEHPSVTVCIPVYNGAAFIAEAVKSVLAQTFRDFELIVLDNASTDATLSILATFQDPRLRIIRHPTNLGACGNFNAALQAARGDWIQIVCADDLLYPEALARHVAALELCGDRPPVLLSGARDIIDGAGRRWMTRGFPGRPGLWKGPDVIRRTVRAGTNLLGEPPGVLIRRDLVQQTGGFDPTWKFCIDVDLWVRMLQRGDVYVHAETLCAFRVSGGSWSITLVRSQAREYCAWMREARCAGLLAATSAFDRLCGRINAYILMAKRWLFYKMLRRRS